MCLWFHWRTALLYPFYIYRAINFHVNYYFILRTDLSIKLSKHPHWWKPFRSKQRLTTDCIHWSTSHLKHCLTLLTADVVYEVLQRTTFGDHFLSSSAVACISPSWFAFWAAMSRGVSASWHLWPMSLHSGGQLVGLLILTLFQLKAWLKQAARSIVLSDGLANWLGLRWSTGSKPSTPIATAATDNYTGPDQGWGQLNHFPLFRYFSWIIKTLVT